MRELLNDHYDGPRKGAAKRGARKADRPAQPSRAEEGRPSDVSPRVWRLAERWIEKGTATLGNRPKVNKGKFSQRLDKKINKPDRWTRELLAKHKHAEWDELFEFMVDKFWDELEEGELDANHQMLFLNDYWLHYLDRADDSVFIKRWRAAGQPVKEYVPKMNERYRELVQRQRYDRWVADSQQAPESPLPTGDRLRKPKGSTPDDA